MTTRGENSTKRMRERLEESALERQEKKKVRNLLAAASRQVENRKKKKRANQEEKKNTIQAGVNLKNTNKYTHKKEGNRKTVLKKPKVKID